MHTIQGKQQSLQNILRRIHDKYRPDMQPIPSNESTRQWIDDLIKMLFPVNTNELFDELVINSLKLRLRQLLQPIENTLDYPEDIVEQFFSRMPAIFEALQQDAREMLRFDPAARSLEEVIAAYPGFYAIAAYRFSHELYVSKVPVLPRLISEYAHGLTGIDINPGAIIGSGLIIDHGTGVVIGETCVLGNNIKIYQGVTLGALSVSKSQTDVKRHPTIEDNVVIYAGTTILGGKTIIGHDSIIGGNVWLTDSVPPYSLVYHKSEVRVRSNNDFDQGINFSI
ncbi:MAG: serine acetyltransferase [Agriterribacter sp.]